MLCRLAFLTGALTFLATQAYAIDIVIYSCPSGYSYQHGKVCLSRDRKRAECLYPAHSGTAVRKVGRPSKVNARTCPNYPEK
jgi:hypothetical protein